MARRPVVELFGAGRVYSGVKPVEALSDVDLSISEGDFVAIVGPSGSGKSTLLNIIGGLDTPTGGTCRVVGRDLKELDSRSMAALRASHIGFVFQLFHLLPHRTVEENVVLGMLYSRIPRRERRMRACDAIKRVGLQDRASFLPTRLSGGERQRVAIARAVAGSPDLLLCDEPTGNLDTATTDSILKLFAELNEAGLTIVVVTHDNAVRDAASRQLEIVGGRLSDVGG